MNATRLDYADSAAWRSRETLNMVTGNLVLASNSDLRKSLKRVVGSDTGTAASAGDVCVANIGPRERKQRLTFGLAAIAVGVVLAIALVVLDADPVWRLLLFIPFNMGFSGYFQARDRT